MLEADGTFETELEIELGVVRDAVLLVATGGARRVIVANLQHGRVVMEPALAIARQAGVSLGGLPTADGRRVDLVVEVAPLLRSVTA
jgi:hypothetical protein